MLSLLFLVGVLHAAPKCSDFAKIANSNSPPAKRLHKLFDAQWLYLMTEYPEYATYVGFPGQNHRWSDYSPETRARQERDFVCMRDALKKIPRAPLKGEDRVSYDLALRTLEMEIEGHKFDQEYMPVNQLGGPQIDVPQLLMAMPANHPRDFEDILQRLEGLPKVLAQTEDLMREGLKRKVTPVKAFLEQVVPQIDKLIPANVEESPLYLPFAEINPDMPEADKIRARARTLLSEKVIPAYKRFKEFMVKEYNPQAREFIAFTGLPNGKAWYAYLVKTHTTSDRTAEELHELGLSEVARIRQEMEKARNEAKFKGDLKAFNKFLLKDKRFFYKSEEELLAGYRDIAKRIDAEVPKLFRKLPRLTYGVRAIPAHAAPNAAGAQYIPGSLEAGRAGWFEANTHSLNSRPKWAMETLTLHEAVPGHHFESARSQEMESLPMFRRFGFFTAFSEGWALYAESLGYELGLFTDPYSKYGNLSDEMLRAVRLVVDTGMHVKGWSREQALKYFREQMPTSDVESESEINRYISWPGQALAYKVGQLKFRELRELSRKELGENFDVRDFHDEVLSHGGLPLDVLEKTVREWIATKKKKRA